MDPRRVVTRGVVAGLRLGRGTADRLVSLAGAGIRRAGGVQDRSAPATFAPSREPDRSNDQADEPANVPVNDPAGPSPATVARNIAPERPRAAPARARTAAKSSPGAKLPPPRTT